MTPRLLITSGEPAGIGPDIVLAATSAPTGVRMAVLGDPALLHERARQTGVPCRIETLDTLHALPEAPEPDTLYCLPVTLKAPVKPGRLDPANASYVLEQLDTATRLVMAGEADAIVTAPVHKGIINEAGIPFTGHTEYFQEKAEVDEVVMMLATPGLRVALATTHLPLRAVADAITPNKLRRVLTILHQALETHFGCTRPHILVAGLNPHAGEDGHLGDEEIRVIQPVLTRLRQQGLHLTGPLPADTLFVPERLATADAVLAMYHDQGLPVLKHMGFGKAVNVTLGLPFIRTSVDHGTALSLAGTGRARADSLRYALTVAQEMITASARKTP